jgi:hypothetical protein
MADNQDSQSSAPSRAQSGLVIAINEPSEKTAGQLSLGLGQMRTTSKSQSVGGMNETISAGHGAAGQQAGGVDGKGASMHSFGSGSSSTNTHGKELVETFYFKMKGTKWNWFSLANNVILLVVLLELAAPAGLFFNIGPDIFTHGYDHADRFCSSCVAAPSSFTSGCTFCITFRIWLSMKRWACSSAT